jgi:hypothetical protein
MKPPVRVLICALLALLTSGCVVSETEQGPGPGDRKKESSDSSER